MNKFTLADAPDFARFAIDLKQFYLKHADDGDIRPTLNCIHNRCPVAVVTAPQVDVEPVWEALRILRTCLEFDSLIFTAETYRVQENRPPRATLRKLKKMARKRFPPGSMQRRYRSGDEAVVPCVMAIQMATTGKYRAAMLPYAYKPSTPFRWRDDEWSRFDGEDGGGRIIEALAEIMTATEPIEKYWDILSRTRPPSYSDERVRFHVARAGFQVLSSKGFLVGESISVEHPEWIGTEETDDASEPL